MELRDSEVKKSISYFTIAAETYKDFAENTSIHGMKYTVKDEIGRREKIFWFLVVICGLCGAGYMTVLFWERYTSNPTRTTILTSYAPTTSIPFPAVTICNVNRIMVSKVEKFMETLEFNETEESTIRNAFPQLLSFTHPHARSYNMTELTILQYVLERNGYFDIALMMEEISQDCKQMLKYCLWNKKNVSCLQNFKISLSYDGPCCSFNYGIGDEYTMLYSPFNGLGTGLSVLLNPMLQPVQYSSLYSSGFKVLIHPSTEYMGPNSDSKIIATGRISYLQIIGTKMTCSKSVRNLPINNRQCVYPDELTLDYFKEEYTDSNCLIECEHKLYFDQCGCVPFYFSFSDKPICNISKIPCLHAVKSNKVISKKAELCKCLPQCEDIFYNVLSTSTTMRYNESMSMMSFGESHVLKGSVMLNIYFLSNTQTILLRDTVTSTIYLLSSFGGVYSLFMGCSLITIAEIIYYCFFRFVINMKVFGRVNIRGDKDKIKVGSKQKPITLGYHPSLQHQQFYYNNVFLP